MKKLFAWFLVLAMCVSMFAGCGQEATPTTPPTEAPTQATEAPVVEDLSDPDGLAAAMEYLRTIYKNAGGLTPKDFTRIGIVPVGTKRFEVVWTASVGEDLVKAVRGEDGMVTIDVNEECDTETPYTLTATITDAAGNSVSYAWEHALPAAMNVGDILDEAFALADGASLPYEVTLTGVITDIPELWSEQYKNINVTMVMEGHEGRPVLCYRLAGDGAKDLAIGDTITVTGTLTNYKGTIEFAQGCTLDNVISGGGEAPKPMEYTRFQPFPDGQKVVIYNLKSGMALSNKKTGYYNVGVKRSSFTAEEVWTAVLHSNGSYSFLNKDGKALSLGKEYGSMNLDDKYDRWNIIKIEPGKFLIQNDGREENFMRWASQYKNWDTKAKSAPEKDVDYVIRFKLLDEEDVPEVEKPDTTMVPELVTSPKAGTAYKLYVEQGNVGKTLYFTGKTANTNYYLATTEDYKEAVDVFVEEVEGGNRLYFMDGEKKVYIDAYANGSYFNARLTAEPTAVFTYNSEYNTYVADLNGTDCYVGAYNSFETLSVSQYKYIATSFPAHLGTLKETVVIKELTVAEAIAKGSAMDHNTYTEEKYYVTGEITEVYNEKYGNMRIKDAEGNILTIYGTYSADGNTRYDSLETKPVAGDTVKLLGVIGQFNGTAQMMNGWIIEHTPGTGGEVVPPVDPEPDTPDTESGVLELTVDSMKIPSNNYYTGTATVDGVELDLTQIGNYGNGVQMRDKDGKTSILFNTTALPGKITKVELTYSSTQSVSYSNSNAVIFSFGAAQDNLTESTKLSTEAGVKSYTITPDGDFTFFKIEHDLGYTLYWDSIKVYFEGDGTSTPDTPDTPDTDGNVLNLTVDTMKIPSQNYYTGSATVNGIALDLTQIGNYGNGVQMRDKDGKTSILFNTTALPGKITKVELTYSSTQSVSYSNSNAVIFSFGAAQDNLTESTKLSTEAGVKSYTITPDGDFTFFKIEHDLGYTLYWDSIKIYYENVGGDVVPEEPEVPEVPEVPGEGGEVGETTTVKVSIAEYATANGWTNGTKYDTLVMDEVITVTAMASGNTGKYYNSGTNWRMYQSESPAITVAAKDKTIVSVKITYTVDKSGVLTLNGSNVASGTVVEVNAPSVTFGVGNTGTETKGQVRITAIEVIYG